MSGGTRRSDSFGSELGLYSQLPQTQRAATSRSNRLTPEELAALLAQRNKSSDYGPLEIAQDIQTTQTTQTTQNTQAGCCATQAGKSCFVYGVLPAFAWLLPLCLGVAISGVSITVLVGKEGHVPVYSSMMYMLMAMVIYHLVMVFIVTGEHMTCRCGGPDVATTVGWNKIRIQFWLMVIWLMPMIYFSSTYKDNSYQTDPEWRTGWTLALVAAMIGSISSEVSAGYASLVTNKSTMTTLYQP